MKWKRFVILLSLFCYFCSSVSAQDIAFGRINWQALDDNLQSLNNEFQFQQSLVEDLKKEVKERNSNYLRLEEAYNIQSVLLESCQIKLTKSKNMSNIWKTTTVIFATSTITLLVIYGVNK